MPYEKLRLLETKIAEAARFIEALRGEKQKLSARQQALRQELVDRREELKTVRRESAEFMPMLDDLLGKLDDLQSERDEGDEAAETQTDQPESEALEQQQPERGAASSVTIDEDLADLGAGNPELIADWEPASSRLEGEAAESAAPVAGPAPHQAHFDRGVELERSGKYEAAIEAYRAALDTAPEFVDAIEHLAFLLEKLNREEEASPLWEKVLALKKTL